MRGAQCQDVSLDEAHASQTKQGTSPEWGRILLDEAVGDARLQAWGARQRHTKEDKRAGTRAQERVAERRRHSDTRERLGGGAGS